MPQWDVRLDCRIDLHDAELLSDVARVDALARVIRGIPLPPGTQRRIDSLNIMRAVRGTTGIEGTEVSETEVQQIIAAKPTQQILPDSRQRAEREVRNAESVMRFVARVLTRNPNAPVTEELIREIHRLTTEGIDYPANEPGIYRSHAVVAGTYVPPRTAERVRELMEEFVRWINSPLALNLSASVRAIASHFYLISIHPFGDGNGRTARALESYVLYQGGINARGFYSLANFYYQNRPEYVAMLDHVRFQTGGDITPFIKFGIKGLALEQEAVHEAILDEVKIIAFRDFAREVLIDDGKLGTKPGERMFHFLLGLADDTVQVGQLRRGGHPLAELYHEVTAKTLSRDLNYLQQQRLILIEDGWIKANVGVMENFIPSHLADEL